MRSVTALVASECDASLGQEFSLETMSFQMTRFGKGPVPYCFQGVVAIFATVTG
jgi:hypothetical protein